MKDATKFSLGSKFLSSNRNSCTLFPRFLSLSSQLMDFVGNRFVYDDKIYVSICQLQEATHHEWGLLRTERCVKASCRTMQPLRLVANHQATLCT